MGLSVGKYRFRDRRNLIRKPLNPTLLVFYADCNQGEPGLSLEGLQQVALKHCVEQVLGGERPYSGLNSFYLDPEI